MQTIEAALSSIFCLMANHLSEELMPLTFQFKMFQDLLLFINTNIQIVINYQVPSPGVYPYINQLYIPSRNFLSQQIMNKTNCSMDIILFQGMQSTLVPLDPYHIVRGTNIEKKRSPSTKQKDAGST